MKQPDPMRRPIPPARSDRWRQPPSLGRAMASGVLVSALMLVGAGCGRSAPVDALGQTEGDPDIAGVTVTSPDAVIEATPTSPGETTTTTAAPAQPQQVLYTVQPGDTLSVIAGNFGVSIDELAAYNGITDINSLVPGVELAIPPAPTGPTEPAPDSEAQGG